MEKRSSHYPLAHAKSLIREGKVRSTFSALAGGAELGFDFEAMIGTVLTMRPRDFYKSMTTHADHRIWQDIYRPLTSAGAST